MEVSEAQGATIRQRLAEVLSTFFGEKTYRNLARHRLTLIPSQAYSLRNPNWRVVMKKVLACAALVALWAAPGFGQTTEELNSDGKNTDNVLTQSMGYSRKS